jgi:hypothetical protein
MSEVVCPQCDERFHTQGEAIPVCPWCHAIDAAHKQCWRCERIFASTDEGITCEHCQEYLSVIHWVPANRSPRTERA